MTNSLGQLTWALGHIVHLTNSFATHKSMTESTKSLSQQKYAMEQSSSHKTTGAWMPSNFNFYNAKWKLLRLLDKGNIA